MPIDVGDLRHSPHKKQTHSHAPGKTGPQSAKATEGHSIHSVQGENPAAILELSKEAQELLKKMRRESKSE